MMEDWFHVSVKAFLGFAEAFRLATTGHPVALSVDVPFLFDCGLPLLIKGSDKQ